MDEKLYREKYEKLYREKCEKDIERAMAEAQDRTIEEKLEEERLKTTKLITALSEDGWSADEIVNAVKSGEELAALYDKYDI